jgi:hypothetical protein
MGEGIGFEGESSHGVVIHYSDVFPVVRCACGTKAPSTAHWDYVDCPACIELRPAYREVEDERAGPKHSSWTTAASMKSAAKRR